jgi:hypothetical protein
MAGLKFKFRHKSRVYTLAYGVYKTSRSNIRSFFSHQLLTNIASVFMFMQVSVVSLKNTNTNNSKSVYKTFFNSII